MFFVRCLLLLTVFIVCLNTWCHAKHTGSQNRKLTVLVFGGNGFIGSATVSRLLKAGHSVTLINRGNWYWDSEILIKPYVRNLKCDRMQSLAKCEDLSELLAYDSSIYFDTVIDFSAYHPFAITEALHTLRGRIGFYVYISTDSVYDVCMKNHTGPSKESDAVRPFDEYLSQDYAKNDNYGHLKLQGEEELQKQSEDGSGVSYIVYRLPDVIGPKDNTYRWWIYQLWMRLRKYLERPVSVPDHLVNQPMSLVYVEDVADVIVKNMIGGKDIENQAYNLGITKNPTLLKVLSDLKNSLNLTNLDIVVEPLTSNSIYLFPSVKYGPIDTSKAVQKLDWNPTPWETILKQIITFYEEAVTLKEYEVPRRDVIRMMQGHLTRRPYQVLVGLKTEYGIDYPFARDEL